MHHCGNDFYIQDEFCTQCGEELNEAREATQVLDLQPRLFEELSQSCPEPTLFTGRLKKSYYYKRHVSNARLNMTNSYWWITLENSQGEIKQISIDAENTAFDSMRVGDVITVLEPDTITLSFKINSGSEQFITNNNLAASVILHNDDGQLSTITKHYDDTEPSISSAVSMGFLLFFFSTLLIFLMSKNGEVSLLSSILISTFSMTAWYVTREKNYLNNLQRKERVQTVISQVNNISKYQLGYHRFERLNKDNDVLCIRCDHRIHADICFCNHCGYHQKTPLVTQVINDTEKVAVEEDNDAAQCNGSTTLMLPQVAPLDPTPQKNIREMRLTKMKEFYFNHTQKYLYRHVLRKNKQHHGSSWCYMVQVIDRNMTTNISDKTYTQTVRIYNEYSNSNSYETRTYRTRESELSGKITVEDGEGELFEQWLPESILSQTDVGDYLLIGYSQLRRGQDQITYGQYFLNLNKGRFKKPESVLSYGKISEISKCVVALSAAATVASMFVLAPEARVIPLIIFLMFMSTVAISSLFAAYKNKKEGNQLTQPIMDIFNKVCDDYKSLLAYFEKLK
ncbi:hypothetical protein Q4557_07135 [Shewanella sp. 5_MG-2023]|uniref:hypothetical protein n=1 Tax=Shewanella sp. 5_MG-2023 TaxID=3062656 RepID=UPI0026E324B3|nr:hypothetical protein [Shewanella sp. 5_MG-2023]MDO6639733.1 hypothetical protein [Shewanella sp. 5_MG-2023]